MGFPTNILVFSFISLIIAVLGIYIYKSKNLDMIAGYNEGDFKGDKKVFAEKTGRFIVFFAILLWLLPFAEMISDLLKYLLIAFMFLVFLRFLWFMNKFHKP